MIDITLFILGVVKRNPIFLHEIEWKNNGFLFTTPNTYVHYIVTLYIIKKYIFLNDLIFWEK